MTSIGAVSGSTLYDINSTGASGYESAFMLALLERIQSLNSDLKAQADEIKARNGIKKAYNDQLGKLDQLLAQAAGKPKDDDGNIWMEMAPGDLPHDKYTVQQQSDGTMKVVPAEDSQSLVTGARVGFRPKEPVDARLLTELELYSKSTPIQRFSRSPDGAYIPTTDEGKRRMRDLISRGQATQIRQCKINPEALAKSVDGLKTQIDSLNTEGELSMLRLNDLLSKTQLGTKQTSELSAAFNKMLSDIIANLRVS